MANETVEKMEAEISSTGAFWRQLNVFPDVATLAQEGTFATKFCQAPSFRAAVKMAGPLEEPDSSI